MALIKNYYNHQFGVTMMDCYWKIELFNGMSGGKENLRVRMNCFKNKGLADTNQGKFGDFDFDFTPDLSDGSPNVFAQAYNYAKTLPEFSGAIDA